MVKKKKRGKKQRDDSPSRHHIIPVSRGGSSRLENIAGLTLKNHQNYHNLFSNRTPEEIIEYLVNDYWNQNWDYVKNAYNNQNE